MLKGKSLFLRIILFLVAWGLIYVVVHLLHVKFFIVDVIFYAGLFDLFLSSVIFGIFYMFFLQRRFAFEKDVVVLTSLLGLACGYIFALTVPTVIDRSLSAYMLEKIESRGGGVRFDALEVIFVEEYIPEYRLMDVRMQEALSSGTVVIENDCVVLTGKGRKVAGMTSFYRKNLLPKRRRLLGEVTDVLTDPFANSDQNVSYLCSGVDVN